MPPLALVAEPSRDLVSRLESLVQAAGWRAIARKTMEDARKDLASTPPDIVITSLKLGTFNGTHLVYLAKLANPSAVCVVYGEAGAGEEARTAGAIYVERRITTALPEILTSTLAAAEKRTRLPFAPRDGRVVDFPARR